MFSRFCFLKFWLDIYFDIWKIQSIKSLSFTFCKSWFCKNQTLADNKHTIKRVESKTCNTDNDYISSKTPILTPFFPQELREFSTWILPKHREMDQDSQCPKYWFCYVLRVRSLLVWSPFKKFFSNVLNVWTGIKYSECRQIILKGTAWVAY